MKLARRLKGLFSSPMPERFIFRNSSDMPLISDAARITSQSIRGDHQRPAILIHGVMPRCGSNYIAKLIADHPHVCPLPNGINEFPLLRHVDDLLRMQNRFFSTYPHNKTVMGQVDFLPLLGSSLMRYFQEFVPTDKTALLKSPHVDNLEFFFSLFPAEYLVIVLRDGRDVVQSTIKTWPEKKSFSDLCKAWDFSAKKILSFEECSVISNNQYIAVKYEDVFNDPSNFINKVCEKFNLDESVYPFEKILETPVIGSSEVKVDGKVSWKGIEKPKDFNPVGRWTSWSLKQRKCFEKYAGETLRKTGYCEDETWVFK